MVLTDPDGLASAAEWPPAYQTPELVNLNADRSTSENKGLQSTRLDDDLPTTAYSSQPQIAEAPTKSKPIIVQLRLRKAVNVNDFVVEKLGTMQLLKVQKDVLLLDHAMTFEEIKDLLQLRSRAKGILPAQNDSESIWPLVSISANHKRFSSDIVLLDHGCWEAGRELLLTREDAILQFDIIVTSAGVAGHESAQQTKKKKDKCAVQ